MILAGGLVSLLATGCGPSREPTRTAPASASTEIRRVDASSLQWGDYLPPLDDGRVELAPPEGWSVAPRRRGYLTQFYLDKTRQARIPRIWITAENSPYDDFQTVDQENLVPFAQAVTRRLQQDGVELLEPPLPMQIGATPCVRYVQRTSFVSPQEGESSRVTAERQMLEIVHGGRLYIVDLHVPLGKMLTYRDAGYAVAASLRFPAPSTSDDTLESPAEFHSPP